MTGGLAHARAWPWLVLAAGTAAGLLVGWDPRLALGAAVGIAFVGAAVARPALLVAAMFGGMLLDKAGVTGSKVDDFPITLAKLSVLGSLALWTVRCALTRERPVRGHPVLVAMLGLVVAAGISIANAGSLNTGKFYLYGLIMMTVMVALVYAILAESVLDGLYRLIAASLLGAVVLTVARSGGSGEAARASGTMGDANEWATIVLLLGSFSLGGLASDPTALGRVLRLGVLIGLPVAIVRSESRSALLAAALVIPALVWLLRGRRGELGLAGLALGLVAPVVLVSDRAWERFGRLLDRFRGGGGAEDASLDERAELFRQGVSLFEDHWFLGVGAGNFANATGFVSRAGRLRPAHNTYLEVAGEQGVVGLSALAAFGVTVAWTLRHALRNARTERDRQRLGGAAIGLAAVAIMAATLGLLTFAMAWLVLGIALALAHQARRG